MSRFSITVQLCATKMATATARDSHAFDPLEEEYRKTTGIRIPSRTSSIMIYSNYRLQRDTKPKEKNYNSYSAKLATALESLRCASLVTLSLAIAIGSHS
jgi:hypothetical protein